MLRIAPEPVKEFKIPGKWRASRRKVVVLLLGGVLLYYLLGLTYFQYFWNGDWGRSIAEIFNAIFVRWS
jgi:hypothetical protein